MTRKTTLQHTTSSADDFIKSKTTKIGLQSPTRRPAVKKTKSSDGKSSGVDSGERDPDFKGTPLKRKNPHRSARGSSPPRDMDVTSPPIVSRAENLAEAEKPPEMTSEERKIKRQVERLEEKRKKEERAARREIRRLEKEEVKKKKELKILKQAEVAAKEAEAIAAEKKAEIDKRDAKVAKEARRAARAEAKVAKEKEDRLEAKAAKDAQAKEEAEKIAKENEMSNDSDASNSGSSNGSTSSSSSTDTEDEMDKNEEEDKDTSYADAVGTGNDDDTASVNNVRWTYRRVRITLKIDVPQDKETRLISLQEKANKIIQLGRKMEPNLYLRKFEETGIPQDDEKGTWIYKFSSTDLSANHFCDHLAHGLSNWIPLDRQTFYFRATLVAPLSCKFAKVLEEISHFIPESCKVSNLLSQHIFDPVKLGNLLRSNEKMTSTDGFLNELNRRARQLNPDVAFGMSFSEMRRPNGERAKDWKKAIRAVQLETNVSCMREATDIALRLFPGKRTKGHKPVWGMNLVFVYDIGHEDVDNLDTAQQNIDTLVSRQKMHMKYENRCSTNKIIPGVMDDNVYSEDPDTFREVLMSIVSTTTEGCEGGKLFSSVMYSDYKNKKEYWFCYHRKVKKEAEAVVRALPVMLKEEYGLTIENLFFETAIDPSDQWNPITRSLRNAITRATDTMLDGTEDLIGDDMSVEEDAVIKESEDISLNTAESRERQRMMGENEEETVINPTKKKQARASAQRRTVQQIEVSEIERNDDNNSISTLGDGTAEFSTDTKKKRFSREVMHETSELVKESAKKADKRTAEMQRILDIEKKRNDDLANQLAVMQRLMAKAGLLGDDRASQSGNSARTRGNNSEQSTGQTSDQAAGSEPEDQNGRLSTENAEGYHTPERVNNRYAPLDRQGEDGSEASSTPSDHHTDSEGDVSEEYTYFTHEDGTITARKVTTHPDGHQTSRKVTSDDEDRASENDDHTRMADAYQDNNSQPSSDGKKEEEEEDDAGVDSNSITKSVQSATSRLKRTAQLILEQATGGIPGGEK